MENGTGQALATTSPKAKDSAALPIVLATSALTTRYNAQALRDQLKICNQPRVWADVNVQITCLLAPYSGYALNDDRMTAEAAWFEHATRDQPSWVIIRATRYWHSRNNPYAHLKPVAGAFAKICEDIRMKELRPAFALLNAYHDKCQRRLARWARIRKDREAEIAKAKRNPENIRQMMRDAGFEEEAVNRMAPVPVRTMTKPQALGYAEKAMIKLKFSPAVMAAVVAEMDKVIWAAEAPPGMVSVGQATNTAVRRATKPKDSKVA